MARPLDKGLVFGFALYGALFLWCILNGCPVGA